MSTISSVTSVATSLASGLEAISTPQARTALRSAELARLLSAVRLGLLSAKATAPKAAPSKTAAAKTAAAKKTTAKKPAAGYASNTSGADFAFLKDPTLSVEEKLFRFMCAIAKQNDDAVLKKMEEMKGGTAKAAAKTGSSTSAKKSSGLSVWNVLKVVFPALGFTAKALGDAKVKSMLTQLSGPVLAAGATALGLPALAPFVLSAGPGLTGAILDGKLGAQTASAVSNASSDSDGTTSKSTATTTTGSSGTGQNEQVQLMELQRLIDKQKEMFAMVSNILRAQHDTRMSIIGNVR
jgi:hypothetical protein